MARFDWNLQAQGRMAMNDWERVFSSRPHGQIRLKSPEYRVEWSHVIGKECSKAGRMTKFDWNPLETGRKGHMVLRKSVLK